MFGSSNCPNCIYAFPEFEKASNIASDFIAFGYADTTLAREAALELEVYTVPSFFLFTDNRTLRYSGKRLSSSFMNFIGSALGEGIDETDESWIDQDENMVVMFTRRFKPPAYYSAAYDLFKSSNIKFGITRNSDVIEAFGNPPTPSIWFFKNGEKTKYQGKQDYVDFINAISDYFEVDFDDTQSDFKDDL